jgi:hypothetical protein
MKSWAGAKSDSNSLELAKSDVKGCTQKSAKGNDAITGF